MLNVNQITSTLSRLSDQGLQQYASMHKDDPYTVSLAVAESNRRKEMRSAQQGMMGGMPQPKVVDQDIEQMAPSPAPMAMPEQQGIGALPAPNMQRMADGGIAGYDDGGMSEGGGPAGQLAFNSEPVMRMADGGVARLAGGGWGRDVFFGGEPETPSFAEERARNMALVNSGSGYAGRGLGILADPRMGVPGAVSDESAEEKPKAKRDTKKESVGAASGAAPAAGAGAGAGADDAGIAGLMKQLTPMTLEERAASAKKLAAEANADSDAAYKKYADQFQAEREELAGRKQQNVGHALMQAGFGMMASKSPHALQGIGEGAMQGLAAYQEANKADDAAKRALMQSETALMQAQRAERSGNHKDAVSLMNQHRQEQQAAVQLGLQAQQIKQTGAYQMGSLQVQREHNALLKERNGMNSDEAKARTEYGKLQAKVMDSLKNDVNYATATPAVQQKMQTDAMRRAAMNNPFLATYAQKIGFIGDPAGGKARTLEGVDYDE